jgi:hypothetical protein
MQNPSPRFSIHLNSKTPAEPLHFFSDMRGLGNLIGAARLDITVLLRKMSFSTCSMIMCALMWCAQLEVKCPSTVDESCSGLLIAVVHLSNQNSLARSLDLQQPPTKHQL